MVTVVDEGRLEHYERIRIIQDRLHHAARITEIVGRAIISIAATGTLLWEMDLRPPADLLRPRLEEFVTSLRQERLVHADLRPWNVFFDNTTGSVTIIDWGFSFFMTEGHPHADGHLGDRGHRDTPVDRIDEADLGLTLKVISGELSPEEAWHHAPDSWDWRPPWVRRMNS